MSFLSFLVFAAVVYLCAADPIGEKAPSDQENLDKMMAAMAKAYDKYFAVMLQGLSEDNLAYMKTTTMDGMGSFLNYALYSSRQETSLQSGKLVLDDLNDIYVQFDSQDSFEPSVLFNKPVQCQNEN